MSTRRLMITTRCTARRMRMMRFAFMLLGLVGGGLRGPFFVSVKQRGLYSTEHVAEAAMGPANTPMYKNMLLLETTPLLKLLSCIISTSTSWPS